MLSTPSGVKPPLQKIKAFRIPVLNDFGDEMAAEDIKNVTSQSWPL